MEAKNIAVGLLLLLSFTAAAQEIDRSFSPTDDETVIQNPQYNPKAPQEKFEVLFEHDWEQNELGAYDNATWRKDWNPNPVWRDSEHARHEDIYIIEDPTTGSKVLELTFPEGSVGTYTNWTCGEPSELRAGGGDYWTSPFTATAGYDELYFAYNVMFRPGFDFVKGGKLPFLAGGPPNNQAATKPTEEMGFDCILMFGTGVEDNRTTGRMDFYVYHQNCPDPRYAEARQWRRDGEPFIFDVSDSIWYNIAVRIKVNSWSNGVGNRDGFIEGFIDGRFIMGMYDLEFLSGLNQGMGIDRMGIASFFGGCSSSHGAKRDEWAWFDDFVVWSFGEEVDVPRGFDRWPPDKPLELPNLKSKELPPPEMRLTYPIDLRTTLAAGSFISLAWDYPQDSLKPNNYRIYESGNEVGTSIGKSYTMGGLQPNTQYIITVTAFNDFDEGDPSQPLIVSTTDPDTIAPTTPTDLRVVDANERTIVITWGESTDNVQVDGYLIYVDGVKVAQSFITEYSVLGLEASTVYNIAISAVDAEDNESPLTEAIDASTTEPDLLPPSKPQGLTTTLITQSTIGIIWENSTDNTMVSGYNIHLNGVKRGTSTTNEYTLSGLSAGMDFAISVSAYDHVDNVSEESDVIIARTKNPDVSTVAIFPDIEILGVSSSGEEEKVTKAISSISDFGHVEILEYGVTITSAEGTENINVSTDQDFGSGRNTFYLLQKTSEVVLGDREHYGLQALYCFDEGSGNVITDKSGSDHPLDLEIQDPSAVTWLPGQGLRVDGNTIISSQDVPVELINALKSTNEISLEAWIHSGEINQSGPARIISISRDNFNRAATLGQVGNAASYDYSARLNTTQADENGLPEVSTSRNFISLNLHHVVYTRDYKGNENIYINGVPLYSGTRGGDFSSLDGDYFVSIANELSGERPWKGTYYLLAIYNKALFSHEVIKNYAAGPGEIRYTSELPVEPNVSYIVAPFALTSQGIVFGNQMDVLVENVLYNIGEDSLYLALYPNPSNGNFWVHIDCAMHDADDAFLRIADMMGQVIYNSVLEELPAICKENSLIDPNAQELGEPLDTGFTDIEIPLSGFLNDGIYSVMLIVGNKAVSRRLIVLQQ
jgi:chitodextrinase